MPYVMGFALAALTFLLARGAGFDRNGAFYPAMLIVIALFYVVFAVMSGSTSAVMIESAVAFVFAVVAVIGFKVSPWIIAAAIAAHGVFDLIHGSLIANPGVPEFWPAFCATFDIAIAAGFSWLILQRKRTRA